FSCPRRLADQRMNRVQIDINTLGTHLTFAVNDISGWSRDRECLCRHREVTFEKRSEGERTCHHHFGRRERRVTGVHIAEVDLPFVRDSGLAEQRLVLVEESDPDSALCQSQCGAATL